MLDQLENVGGVDREALSRLRTELQGHGDHSGIIPTTLSASVLHAIEKLIKISYSNGKSGNQLKAKKLSSG